MSHITEYEQVFTPAAPVRSRKLFLGRAQEEVDIHSDLRRPGMHPIVIGDRGVGKTTLVRQAIPKNKGRIIVACGQHTSFSDLARAILHEIGYQAEELERTIESQKVLKGGGSLLGALSVNSEGVHKETSKHRGLAGRELSPWTLYQCLRDHHQPLVVVLD